MRIKFNVSKNCFICILLLVLNVNLAAKTVVNNIRVWQSSYDMRIVFDVNQAPHFTSSLKNKDTRLVVDLVNTWCNVSRHNLPDKSHWLNKIKEKSTPNNGARLLLDFTMPIKAKVYTLPPCSKYGYRLVIDLSPKNLAPPTITVTNAPYIVVIDPGHGGEDPGAIGPSGLKEKDVVLKIAKELQSKLNSTSKIQAYLTRDGDYYVKLQDRVKFARKYRANLFISIHADAYKNPKSQGASVFKLSYKGASSAAASWLAFHENQSDIFGELNINKEDKELASVLFDLGQRRNLQDSSKLAKAVLVNLGKEVSLHKPHVEEAGFLVLKAPDIPSILVESGFISNPKTERQLKSTVYRRQLAHAIGQGVVNYLNL